LPSFIAVGIIPFLIVSVLFGFKNTASAFSSAVKKETEKVKLLKAVEFFIFYGKITWIAALIAVILGTISILANMEDKAALGPNVALALTSLLYGGLINALLILPFTFLLKKQLVDKV
jgi:flagellar motor component MotA